MGTASLKQRISSAAFLFAPVIHPMRFFKNYVPLGNDTVSVNYCRLLHKRLDDALSLNSALEQGYSGSSDELLDLDDVVRDIAAALLGKSITIGRKIPNTVSNGPYPAEWNTAAPSAYERVQKVWPLIKATAKIKVTQDSQACAIAWNGMEARALLMELIEND